MLRLNLGSGQRKFGSNLPNSPWVNVDIQPRWDPDVVADCSNMPMFADGSADIIVCHHTLEHYGCGEADAMLKECYRILCVGGSLLIFLPDIHALALRWLKHEISDYIYIVNLMGGYMGDEADRHKWHYTAESLHETLDRCGHWQRFITFNYREIPGADLARDFWIAAYEAVKI